jgi:hypothetical protein
MNGKGEFLKAMLKDAAHWKRLWDITRFSCKLNRAGRLIPKSCMPLKGVKSKPYAILNILLSKVAFFLLD